MRRCRHRIHRVGNVYHGAEAVGNLVREVLVGSLWHVGDVDIGATGLGLEHPEQGLASSGALLLWDLEHGVESLGLGSWFPDRMRRGVRGWVGIARRAECRFDDRQELCISLISEDH